MKVTVVILTHHRYELIKLCLESVKQQKNTSFEYEIFGLLNGQDPKTHQFLEQYAVENNNFKFLAIDESLPVGEARNKIINNSSGEYICFIDDDVEIPQNYFETAERIISTNPNIDVFGGPDRKKNESSEFQIILDAIMQSFFAMGPTSKRHTKIKKEEKGTEVNLILCNLWMRRELFEKGYEFPHGYIRNEENILLGKLEQDKKVMLYTPDLFVFHSRKESLIKLIRVTFLSGQYRTFGFFDSSKTFSLWFLVPQAFLIVLIASLFLSSEVFLLLFSTYFIFIYTLTLIKCIQVKTLKCFSWGILIYLVYNFVYPIGQFSGYIKRLLRNKR